MAKGFYEYAEILAQLDGHITDARRVAVVPVLTQDEKLTPEERETLAGLSVALNEIAVQVEELRKGINRGC